MKLFSERGKSHLLHWHGGITGIPVSVDRREAGFIRLPVEIKNSIRKGVMLLFSTVLFSQTS